MGRTGSKKREENTVVNRGRVRHATFRTGVKVVESAGVVRVPQVVSDRFKIYLG